MSDPRLVAHNARPCGLTSEAWWYEDDHGIDIYIRGEGGTLSCCIPWAILIRAAQRSSGQLGAAK